MLRARNDESPPLAGCSALAQLLQSLPNLDLVPTLDRFVIAALLRQIRLIDPAALEIVAVLVTGPVSQLLGPPVTGVAEMLRHLQRSALAHIFSCLADRQGGRIRLGRRGDVGDRLGQR